MNNRSRVFLPNVVPVLLALFLCAVLLLADVAAAAPSAAVIDVNEPLNLPVSTTAVITSAHLHTSSPNLPNLVVYTYEANTTLGTLKLNNVTLNQNDTFTQDDIDNDRLTYTAPAAIGTDAFNVSVDDGIASGGSVDFTIHINKPEPTNYPTGFTATANSISQITAEWTDTTAGPAPDGYIVLCSSSGFPAAPADTSYLIHNQCTDGSGSAHVALGVQTYVWDGLNSETTYNFAVYPYAHTSYPDGSGEYYDYYTADTAPQASAQTFKTYSISGMVTDAGFTPLMSILVDAGGGHTALTGEDGSFTITGLAPGDYTVSISMLCYTFVPEQVAVTVSEAQNHPGGVSFTGTRWPCIHGTVYDGAAPLDGVTISNGAGLSAVTQADGSYALPVTIAHWSGSLWPQKTNYYFTPERRTYIDVTVDEFLQGYGAHRVKTYPRQFIAAWNATPGALGYFLEVAVDPAFTTLVPGYENLDVGSVIEYQVAWLTPGVSYYYRVRPYDYVTTGEYSIPVEVVTVWGFYFPTIYHP